MYLRQLLLAMAAPPAGISEADWLVTPVAVRALIVAEQEEIEQLSAKLTALATELASLRERIGRCTLSASANRTARGVDIYMSIFWAWAMATPQLQLLICEGFKKALAAVSAGWAALALPGVQMGRRVQADGSARLIPALQLLAAPKRPWLIAFDAERRPSTAGKVAAAAGALAHALRVTGGRPLIARMPLLGGTDKTGLDDLLAAAGREALERALADTGPRAVLPQLRAADTVAPAGQFLGLAAPLPSPELAPLVVVVRAPMGCGKTWAAAEGVAPLQADGVPILMPPPTGRPWGRPPRPPWGCRGALIRAYGSLAAAGVAGCCWPMNGCNSSNTCC